MKRFPFLKTCSLAFASSLIPFNISKGAGLIPIEFEIKNINSEHSHFIFSSKKSVVYSENKKEDHLTALALPNHFLDSKRFDVMDRGMWRAAEDLDYKFDTKIDEVYLRIENLDLSLVVEYNSYKRGKYLIVPSSTYEGRYKIILK